MPKRQRVFPGSDRGIDDSHVFQVVGADIEAQLVRGLRIGLDGNHRRAMPGSENGIGSNVRTNVDEDGSLFKVRLQQTVFGAFRQPSLGEDLAIIIVLAGIDAELQAVRLKVVRAPENTGDQGADALSQAP